MNNKVLIIIVSLLLVVTIALGIILVKKVNSDNTVADNVKFAQSYTKLTDDNVFVYKNIDEIINVLEHGTGIVFFGFPECPWCQQYVTYLNDVAKQNGIEKIYYYDIKEDRQNNTDNYKKIVEILGDNLAYDADGNKRVYVPDVTFVVQGVIVGHDNESSYDVTGTPEEYWTDEKVNALKQTLQEDMDKVKTDSCSACDE